MVCLEITARLEEAINHLPPLQQEVFRLTWDEVSAARDRLASGADYPPGLWPIRSAAHRRLRDALLALPPQTRSYARRPKGTQKTEDRSGVGEVTS